MISDQNCTTRSLITTLLQHFEIAEFSQYQIKLIQQSFREKWQQKGFYTHFVIETKMMRCKSKTVAISNKNYAIQNMNDKIFEQM